MNMLKGTRLKTHAPTQRATAEEIPLGSIRLTCFDLGGHLDAREVWKDYFVDASAIIYIIDASDPARFVESKGELDAILTNPALIHVPVLVLGNKIDLPKAVSEPELRAQFGLDRTTGKTGTESELRPIEVFMACIIDRNGYPGGIRWLAQYIG